MSLTFFYYFISLLAAIFSFFCSWLLFDLDTGVFSYRNVASYFLILFGLLKLATVLQPFFPNIIFVSFKGWFPCLPLIILFFISIYLMIFTFRKGKAFIYIIPSFLFLFLALELLKNDLITPAFQLVVLFVYTDRVVKDFYKGGMRKDFYILALIAFICFLAMYFFSIYRLEHDRKLVLSSILNRMRMFRARIVAFEERCARELKLLANHPLMLKAIRKKNNVLLNFFKMILDSSALYVMDREGNVVVSSESAFLGENYSFRPYFKEAINGRESVYLARGVTSHKIGIYFARPLFDKNLNIKYVIVMKMDIFHILSDLKIEGFLLIYKHSAILLGPKGYENCVLYSLPSDSGTLYTLKYIFGGILPSPLNFRRKGSFLVSPDDKKYFFVTLPVYPEGWEIGKLVPYKDFLFQYGGGYLAVYFFLLSLVVISGARIIQYRYWMARIREEEERRVEVEKMERLLSKIVQHSKNGVFVVSKDGVIEYVNEGAKGIVEADEKDLIGKGLDVIGVSYRELVEKGEWQGLLRCKRKSGEVYEADSLFFPIEDRYVLIQRDVTKERRLEKQLMQAQKMEAVGTLAGGIAHDFNNILTALQGYTEIALMRLREGDSPVKNYLNRILSVIQKAQRITQQLLIFSRKESGEKISINLNKIIEDMHDVFSRLIGENIKVTVKLDKNIPNIVGDPVAIEQVLMNLVVNAKDAIKGTGEITIETRLIEITDSDISRYPEAKPGKYVRLSVKDTGCGIPKDIMDRIFDPFFTTKKGKGTGLGLSLVYSIVKQHNGWIAVDSEEGKGTVFHIYLPVEEVKLHEVKKDKARKDIKLDAKGKTVLYIEDDKSIREVTSTYLKEFNFRVLEAPDIKTAREIYSKERDKISLIISDVVLTDGNGFEFVKEIRPRCPVILCTGYINQEYVKTEAKRMGYYFLNKPYSKEDLEELIISAVFREIRTDN